MKLPYGDKVEIIATAIHEARTGMKWENGRWTDGTVTVPNDTRKEARAVLAAITGGRT